MARHPRALVISPVIDGKSLLATVEKVFSGFTEATLKAQVRNTAYITRGSKVWLLFPFLDKGTSPHYIGEGDELLANKQKSFGPVWGPVFHPGSRPYDITARVEAYFQSQVKNLLQSKTVLSIGSITSEDVPVRLFRRNILWALKLSVEFARTITPDSWRYVKDSYELYLNGRKVE